MVLRCACECCDRSADGQVVLPGGDAHPGSPEALRERFWRGVQRR